MNDKYFFGQQLAVEIDYFAFPRTGSHFFRYCTMGLFDLVAIPHANTQNEEAIDRQREIEPTALYALNLREDGIPYQPVLFHTRVSGQHGEPEKRKQPVIILMRDPLAAVYSLYQTQTVRWGKSIPDPVSWVSKRLEQYCSFYDKAMAIAQEHRTESLLIRYEQLVQSADTLARVVDLVGVQPKLSPQFVHWITAFKRFARSGERTFYRAADNDAWSQDQEWLDILRPVKVPDFSRFGYSNQKIPVRVATSQEGSSATVK